MKEYKCKICGRSYLNKFGLIAHQNKILCPGGCGKRFSVWGMRERVAYHLRKEHNWEGVSAIEICELIEKEWRNNFQLPITY